MIKKDSSLALQPENNSAAAAVLKVSMSKQDVALGHAWSVLSDFAMMACPAQRPAYQRLRSHCRYARLDST